MRYRRSFAVDWEWDTSDPENCVPMNEKHECKASFNVEYFRGEFKKARLLTQALKRFPTAEHDGVRSAGARR